MFPQHNRSKNRSTKPESKTADNMMRMRLNRLFKVTAVTVLIFTLTFSPALADELSSKKAEIESLQAELDSIASQIEALNQEITSLQGRIEGLKQQIDEEQAELDSLNNEINLREQALKQRVRQLYVKDASYSLSMVLNADSFFDFVDKARLLTFLVRADSENLERLKQARARQKEVIEKLNRDRTAYELYIAGYQERISELELLEENKKALLSRAKYEYNVLLRSRTQAVSRGYVQRNGGYSPSSVVPRKFAEVSPYGGGWLTSQRMPDSYTASGKKWTCVASWYGNEFHGRRTASGEIFNQWDFTVAHRTLPFGTFVAIEYRGRKIVAMVNDRGPFIPGREFDLSRGCAEALGFTGLARITVEIVHPK